MKKYFLYLMIILFLIVSKNISFASEDIIKEGLNNFDFSEIQSQIDKISYDNENEDIKNFDFKEYVKDVTTGRKKFDLKDIVFNILQKVIVETKKNFASLISIFIAIVLSSIIKNLTDSFKNKEVGKIAMYITNIVIVIAIFNTFRILVNISYETINTISNLTMAVVPIFLISVATTGNITTAKLSHTAIFSGIQFIAQIVKRIFLPLILIITIMEIANYISEKEILGELNDFLKKIISWSLKGIFTLFFSITAIQRFTAPVIDGIAKKGVKFATKAFVPILGDIMNSAVDTIINCCVLIKNGIGIVAIIVVLLVILIPVVKIISYLILYKLVASLVQPIADKKIIKCFSKISENCSLLLSCILTVSVMFIVSIAMLMTIMH